MSLQIVKYNVHHKINKYLRCLLYIVLVFVYVVPRKYIDFYLPLIIIVLLVCIIYRENFEVYTRIGACSIDLHSVLWW